MIGLAFIAGGWIVYDTLCKSPLGRDSRVLGVAWGGVLVASAYELCHIFSGRGAFIHVGAMIGTAMAANVFAVIIPNQKKTVAALLKGEKPDPRTRPDRQAAFHAQQLHDAAGPADHDQQPLPDALQRALQLADPLGPLRRLVAHPRILQPQGPGHRELRLRCRGRRRICRA